MKIFLPFGEQEVSSDGVIQLRADTCIRVIDRLDYISLKDFPSLNGGDDDFLKYIKSNTQGLYVENVAVSGNHEKVASEIATVFRFCAGMILTPGAIRLPYAVYFDDFQKISQLVNLPDARNLRSAEWETLSLNTKLPVHGIPVYFAALSDACENEKNLAFILHRFNSALSRPELYDRIVDLSICLESLTALDNEGIAFRFSLYNAFLYTEEELERQNNFRLMNQLYSARSGIVHGSLSKREVQNAIEEVSLSWTAITQLARHNINYYVLYVSQAGGSQNWQSHLKSLVLGTEQRINSRR